MECAWHLFAERTDGLGPPVQRLAIHLKDTEAVLFNEGDNMQQVLQQNRTNTLTAWFQYNQQHEDGLHLT